MDKKNILIVDDDPDIRELAEKSLQQAGFETVSASSGLLGLRLLCKMNFDVLISDINMPQMNGVDFVRKAKALHPHLVIILLTGYASIESAQEAVKIGISDYLTKPIKLEQLKTSINGGLSRAGKERQGSEYYRRLEDDLKASQAEMDAAKNELIVLISHELRTPVTVVTSAFDILKETMELPAHEKICALSEEKRKQLFDKIEKGHRRLITIIEDLGFYLNLIRGSTGFEKELVELNTFLGKNFEVFRHLIKEYGAELNLEFPQEPIEALICKERMLDVLERLIHNAAVHNPSGTKITLRLGMAPQKRIELEVSDNGKGINADLLRRIFVPFAISDIDHHGKGLGMGLCICKKVIELQGGNINLDSQEGKGTKVTIELPAKEV